MIFPSSHLETNSSIIYSLICLPPAFSSRMLPYLSHINRVNLSTMVLYIFFLFLVWNSTLIPNKEANFSLFSIYTLKLFFSNNVIKLPPDTIPHSSHSFPFSIIKLLPHIISYSSITFLLTSLNYVVISFHIPSISFQLTFLNYLQILFNIPLITSQLTFSNYLLTSFHVSPTPSQLSPLN